MKKLLLASSAIVALSAVSAPAMAQSAIANAEMSRMVSNDFDIEVHGFIEQGLFWGRSSRASNNNLSSVALATNAEIHFQLSKTLDSGMTVGGTIEMEADSGAGGIDEVYVYADGGFGRVEIGAQDPVSSTMGVAAPDSAILDVSAMAGGYSFRLEQDYADISDDANKVIYKSPSLAGVQLGVSYAPSVSEAQNNRRPVKNNAAISYAVNYSGDFGGVTLDAALGGERGGSAQQNASDLAFGVNVGILGRANVGAAYRRGTKTSAYTALGTVNRADEVVYSIAGTYNVTDDMLVGLRYVRGHEKQVRPGVGPVGQTHAIHWQAYVNYDLSPGATLGGIIQSEELAGRRANVGTSGVEKGTLVGATLSMFF